MRARAAGLVVLLGLAGTVGCAGDEPDHAAAPAKSANASPVVVDTDLASDDLVALTFLLASPDVDVRAVTVSGTGEVRCPRGAEIVRGLLEATGDADIPVACGRSTPLGGDRSFPEDWRAASDSAWGLDLPDVDAAEDEPTAVELLTDTLAASDETTLLTLGPLTNVAEAFRSEPALVGQVDEVVVMGGAVDVPGNVMSGDPGAAKVEWNMYVDPTAAAEVLASGARVVLVGLDATDQAPITPAFVTEADGRTGTSEGDPAAQLLETNGLVATGDAFFWDPLAAAFVADRQVVTLETVRVSVRTEGDEAGRTYRDGRGAEISVAVGIDVDGLEDLLLDAWAG